MVQFSLFFNFDTDAASALDTYRCVVDQAVVAEQLGFDAIWVSEHHHNSFGKLPDPFAFLAYLAARTQHIRLGTAVVLAPLYHPVRLAESFLTVDGLSNGRLTLGLGSGGLPKAAEIELFGVDIDARHELLRTAAHIVEAAFYNDRVSFSGEHVSLTDAQLHPRPRSAATGASKIWIAASESTADFAGAHGYGLLFQRGIDRASKLDLLARYTAAAHGAGHTPRVAIDVFVVVADSVSEAHRHSEPVFRHYYRPPGYRRHPGGGPRPEWDGELGSPEHLRAQADIAFVVGDPATVYAGLRREIDEVNAHEVLIQSFAGPVRHDDALRSNSLLVRAVLPALRSRYTARDHL